MAVFSVALAGALLVVPVAGATTTTGCPELLVAQHSVAGYVVGETACAITGQSAATDDEGRSWTRVDVALSGTAAGWVDPQTQGNTRKDVTDVPNVLFPQFGITSWVAATATYSGGDGTGAGLSVLYPDKGWNGKTVLLAHGQSNDSPLGALVKWPEGAAVPADTFDNLYADEWMNAGYAVIYTRRPASSGVPAVLADGTRLDESLNDNVAMALDFLRTGEALLQERLHRAPSTVLWYGHSAGVILGRLLNYSGLNSRPGGGHYVDGFLSDDPGGGLPLPLSMPEGQVLGTHDGVATWPQGAGLSKAATARIVPELTLAHSDYLDAHTWLPGVTYLTLKQQGQDLYDREGIASRTRLYTVAGVSHIPASSGSPPMTLDMGGLVEGVIGLVDAWVTHGTPPPASITGRPGDANVADQLRLPPIACPTGLRYPWPAPGGAASQTGYAAYDGTSMEPVDSRGALVDVDGRGYRGVMPSWQQEWQSLGLVRSGQRLTEDMVLSCVRQATSSLVAKRLLPASVAQQYIAQATKQGMHLSW
jgi:hypothetical protein